MKTTQTSRLPVLQHRANADNTPNKGLSRPAVMQLKWNDTTIADVFRWHALIGGLQWFYDAVTSMMYFTVQEPLEEEQLQSFAGIGHARSYDNWVLLWNQLGILNPTEASHSLVVPGLTEHAGNYTPDETQELINYTNRQPGTGGINYLLNEFARPPEIPSYLNKPEVSGTIGRDVSKSEARKLEPVRRNALLKISSVIPSSSRKEVLMVGGSKDFVFPFMVTGGQAERYHMLSGELGNAEAIRKTIAYHTPDNPAVSITTTTVAEGIKRFVLILHNGTTFEVISYDMLYGDFFHLQETQGLQLGIPSHFDLTMDQMSWISMDSPSMEKYTDAAKEGGYIASDMELGGNVAWILNLLGIKHIPVDWGADEFLGYSKANIYQKIRHTSAPILRFHTAISPVLTFAKNRGFNLNTDEGLVKLALSDDHINTNAERLINSLTILIEALGEQDGKESGASSASADLGDTLLSLKGKRDVLFQNRIEEGDATEPEIDPVAESGMDNEQQRWLEENSNKSISVTDLWNRFSFEKTDHTFMLEVVRGTEKMKDAGLVLVSKRLSKHRFKITEVNKVDSGVFYKITPE
jgi:hypothetical protein